MEEGNLKLTAEDFFVSTRGLNKEDLVQFWEKVSSGWSVTEKVSSAVELAEKNIWLWDPIFDNILSSENPKDSYPLLVKIIEKVGTAVKLEKFKIRCQKNRSFSREHVKFLEQEKTNNTAKFSGLLIAVSFREIPEDWSEIKTKLSSKHGLDQLSAAFTIRVLDNNKQTTSIPASLSAAILDQILENRSSEVKKQLVWFFISNYNPADKRTSHCVTTIFHDIEVLGNALDALSIDNPVPKDIRFEILEKASDFEDRDIPHKISRCIAIWGKDDVARSLKLCKNIALFNHHHIPGELIWGIEEMSKDSIEESLDVVESWLSERISEGERILRERFLYPEFLIVLTINDRSKLVKRLVKLSQKESNNDLVIETIHEYIETIPRKKDWSPINDQDDVCLQSCVDSLKTIALRMGKDAERFPNKNR